MCEYVQHLSIIDYVAISITKDDKRIELVDHLHEYFKNPCIVKNGAYVPPQDIGFSIEMFEETLKQFAQ